MTFQIYCRIHYRIRSTMLTLRRQRQKDCYKTEVSLGYIVNFRTSWATGQEPNLKKKMNKQNVRYHTQCRKYEGNVLDTVHFLKTGLISC